ARTHHRLARPSAFTRQPLVFEFEQAGTKNFQRLRLVLVLGLLVLLNDHQTAWQVRDAHSAVGRVDRLPAWTRGAINVDPQVLVVDLHIDVLRLRQNRDCRRRSVDAPAAFGHRHALHAVDAALELEAREHAWAVDRGHRLLVAADFRRARGDEL